jgi:hypothetical protein
MMGWSGFGTVIADSTCKRCAVEVDDRATTIGPIGGPSCNRRLTSCETANLPRKGQEDRREETGKRAGSRKQEKLVY